MRNYPDKWDEYCDYVRSCGRDVFGFSGQVADVNRFAARYRVACSFRRIELDKYSDQTERGYSALFRVVLVWSAFESFLGLVAYHQSEAGDLLEKYGAQGVRQRLRDLDSGGRFYAFIYKRVNKAHRNELDLYMGDDPCNVSYLASAIRHIFVHRALTPNANRVAPETCIQICEDLSAFLLDVMNREFGERVDTVIEEINSC